MTRARMTSTGAHVVRIISRAKLRVGWMLALACAPGHLRCVDSRVQAMQKRIGCARCAGAPHPIARIGGMPDGPEEEASRRFVGRTRRIGLELHMLEIVERRRFAP